MSDALTVVARVAVTLGGAVAAVYYGLRVVERLRERTGHISVKVLGHGFGYCVYDDAHLGVETLYVNARLYNPKAAVYSMSEPRLCGTRGALLLKPLKQLESGPLAYVGTYPYLGPTTVELPPKRHTKLTLGIPAYEAQSEGQGEEARLVFELDNGDQIASEPFRCKVDWARINPNLLLEV